MYSFAFPNMITSCRTNLIKDHEATMSNLRLLLGSNQGGLLGDPQFGTTLTRMFFEQNDDLIKELVVDEIYTTIETFLPQFKVKREDITVEPYKTGVRIGVKGVNLIDYQLDTFDVAMTNGYE